MPFDKQSDHLRFLKHYTAHEQSIRGYVRRLVPKREDANDVMQEVALVLWRKFDQLRSDDDFRRWAFGVARLQVLAWRRDRARENERFILSETIIDLLADESDTVSTELDLQREMILQRCLGELNNEQRAAIEAMYSENSDTSELANRFGKTIPGFHQWLYRIRQALAVCAEREAEVV